MNMITISTERTVIRIPRVGQGQLSSELLDRVGVCDKAFILTLLEAAMTGEGSRMVTSIAHSICGSVIPADLVANRRRRVQELVETWSERSLSARSYPFMIVEAHPLDVRVDGRPRPHVAVVAAAVDADGHREVAGVHVERRDAPDLFPAFFGRLASRGLSGVDLVVSSDHQGLLSAIPVHWPSARWQHNQDDVLRQSVAACPPQLQRTYREQVSRIFDASDLETAAALFADLRRVWGSQCHEGTSFLHSRFDNVMAVMELPAAYRARLRTTRSIERIAADIARPQRVIRVFPSVASASRLVGALAMEVDRSWSDGPRYMNMNAYWEWKQAGPSALSGSRLVKAG